jgi:hypothetical protein
MWAAVFVASVAFAADQPTWAWPTDTPRRYYLESHGIAPDALPLHAPTNHITRFSRYEVAVVARCAPSTKKVGRLQNLRCDLEDFAVRVSPLARDQHQVAPTLTQLEALKEGLWVQLAIRDDGTMTAFDVEGLPDRTERDRRVQQDLRVLLQRAFVGLQISLDGDAEWAKPWVEKNAQVSQPIGRRDAMSRTEHTPTLDVEKGVARIQSSGVVTMRTGGGGANTSPTLKGNTGGMTVWDTEEQCMVGRQWWTHAAGAGVVYTDADGTRKRAPQAASQAGLVLLVADGDDAPSVGPWGAGGFQGRSVALVAQKMAESAAE